MKISEFEQRLQERDTPKYFPPNEDKWLRLEADLRRKKRKAIIVPFPKKMLLAAASVAILASIGIFTYNHLSEHTNEPVVSRKQLENSNQQTTPITHNETIVAQPTPVTPPDNSTNAANTPAKSIPTHVARTTTQKSLPASTLHPKQNSNLNEQQEIAPLKEDIVVTQHPSPIPPPVTQDPNRSIDRPPVSKQRLEEDRAYAARAGSPVIFGVSALYGFSAISKSQYRLSVSASKAIAGPLFANVQVVAANTNVSISNTYNYQVIALGAPGVSPESESKDVDAVYTARVYSVGVTPSVGVKIGKRLALAAGPDLQKTLSTKVPLQNKDEFLNKANSESLVDDQKRISDFDFGMQSTAQINLSKRAAFNVMYRYGLTKYLNNQSGGAKNSFVCVGLSYSLE